MWVRWMSEVDSTGGRFYRGSACPSSPAFQQSRGWAWVPGVEITTRLPSLQAACAILGSDSEVSSLKSLGAEADFTAAAPRAQRHKACALPEPPSPLMAYWKIHLVCSKLTVMQLGWQGRKRCRAGCWFTDEEGILMFVRVVRDSLTIIIILILWCVFILTYSYGDLFFA